MPTERGHRFCLTYVLLDDVTLCVGPNTQVHNLPGIEATRFLISARARSIGSRRPVVDTSIPLKLSAQLFQVWTTRRLRAHLRQLAEKVGIPTANGEGQPYSGERNDDLRGPNAYDKGEQKM